jgi:hypothetical protein
VAVEIEDRWTRAGVDLAAVGFGLLAAVSFAYAAAIVLGVV